MTIMMLIDAPQYTMSGRKRRGRMLQFANDIWFVFYLLYQPAKGRSAHPSEVVDGENVGGSI